MTHMIDVYGLPDETCKIIEAFVSSLKLHAEKGTSPPKAI